MKSTAFEIDVFLTQVQDAIQPLAAAKSLDVHVSNLCQETPYVIGQRHIVFKVACQLAANVIAAADAGCIALRVQAAKANEMTTFCFVIDAIDPQSSTGVRENLRLESNPYIFPSQELLDVIGGSIQVSDESGHGHGVVLSTNCPVLKHPLSREQVELTECLSSATINNTAQSDKYQTEQNQKYKTQLEKSNQIPLVDHKALEKLVSNLNNDRDFVNNLIQIFIRDSYKILKEIDQELKNHSSRVYSDQLHALKGIAGLVHAKRLRYICDKYQMAHDATDTEIAVLMGEYTKIKQCLDKTVIELNVFTNAAALGD